MPVSEVCEVLQIPAFLCRQTDLIVAAAKTKKVINIKKPQFSSASELSHAIKKCEVSGNPNIILCERGNMYGYNDLVVDPRNLIWLRSDTNLVSMDITHCLQQPAQTKEVVDTASTTRQKLMGSGYGGQTIMSTAAGVEDEANVAKTVLGGGRKRKIKVS